MPNYKHWYLHGETWETICADGRLYLSNTFADLQELNGDRLEQMISMFGEFDLVIDGSHVIIF